MNERRDLLLSYSSSNLYFGFAHSGLLLDITPKVLTYTLEALLYVVSRLTDHDLRTMGISRKVNRLVLDSTGPDLLELEYIDCILIMWDQGQSYELFPSTYTVHGGARYVFRRYFGDVSLHRHGNAVRVYGLRLSVALFKFWVARRPRGKGKRGNGQVDRFALPRPLRDNAIHNQHGRETLFDEKQFSC